MQVILPLSGVPLAKQKERRIEQDITEGRVSQSVWKIALPMMVGGFLQDLFSLVDLFFVGRLGHVEVAALSLAGTVMAILLMLVQGIGVGTTALVAHFVGRKEYERADEVVGQTLLLGAAGSLIMLGVSFLALEPLLRLFGATGDVLTYTAQYLRINFVFSLVIFFFNGMNQALRGSGDAMTPLIALAIGNVLNIILDPILIMGYGPFPKMGVAGSATATVITRSIGLIFIAFHLTVRKSTLRFKFTSLKPNPVLMERIVSIGAFGSLQVLVREISLLLLMRLITSFGDVTLAAYGIGNRLRQVIMVPGQGFAAAAAVLVGQNLGAGKPDRAARCAWRTVAYYECFAVPMSAILIALAPQLVAIFNNHPDVIRIGASFIRYLGVTFPFIVVSLVLSQAMNGAGDSRTATIINAIGQLAFRIPVAYLFARNLGLGPAGIWLGINSSDIVQGVGMAFAFQTGHWQKVYAGHKEALERSAAAFDPSRSK
jgi:putative MATE family efflux protein